jgi:hypothetical protein
VTDPDLVGLFVEPLERLGIPYMVTGGVATVIYGDPRFTRDIDVVLELRGRHIEQLATEFSGDAFYVPPLEVLEEEATRQSGGHFNLIHRDTSLRADVYLIGEDPLHLWAFGQRKRFDLHHLAIWVAPIEYVILRKLEYYRSSGSERHVRDVALMLRISGNQVDGRVLDAWIDRLDLRREMDQARRYTG